MTNKERVWIEVFLNYLKEYPEDIKLATFYADLALKNLEERFYKKDKGPIIVKTS